MNGSVNVQHGADYNHGIPWMASTLSAGLPTARFGTALPWGHHNGDMDEPKRTDIPTALQRVMAAHPSVGNVTRWAAAAALPRQTVADATKGANTTLTTLLKLATAAGMTLAEMLEYGDPDWDHKAAARELLNGMSKDEIAALTVLLRGKEQKGEIASS